jgi:Ca2+-transporting ATPase
MIGGLLGSEIRALTHLDPFSLDRRKSRWSAVGDSTEAALLSMTAKAGISNKEMLAKYPRIGMIPFESSRKMMTSVHRNPDGEIIAYVKGASSEVLARSKSIYWQGKIIPLTEDISNEVRIRTDSYAREAYRVLGLAIRSLSEAPTEFKSELIESNLTFVGLVAGSTLPGQRRQMPFAWQGVREPGS